MVQTKELIHQSFDNAERIGVVGSPSTTNDLTIDILGTAVNKRLVGNLSIFNYTQDGKDHYALGQITEIEMRNIWTQDATIRGLIRQKGRVDPITEKQDVHIAKMMISSVFSTASKVEQSILGTVPSTGTLVKLLDKTMMDALLVDYKSELFYLGNAYGTDIKMPMWFKHFGNGVGGIGEAYHIGIFGKTGSGKSKLALMMMSGYAKHKNMSIFVLDPQNQFAKEFQKDEMKSILTKIGRTAEIISLHNLVLSGYELFKRILVMSKFLERNCMIIHEDNQGRAANQIVNILQPLGRRQTTLDPPIRPWEANTRPAFDRVWNAILTNNQIQRAIYTGQDGIDRMLNEMNSRDPDQVYDEWRRIANLFTNTGKTNSKKIKEVVENITSGGEGKILIIDLSEDTAPRDIYWTEEMKHIVISEFLSRLSKLSEIKYRKDESLLNTLVIIDEAHRLAPREYATKSENLEQVKLTLIDAVRTTRKYGLGWLFISQTLSSLDREIINQLRIYIFGFGLAWGLERQALREIIGGADQALGLYQMFKDPQSTLGDKEYPFMSIGPISPLSFSGTPLFFTSLKYPERFIELNNLK